MLYSLSVVVAQLGAVVFVAVGVDKVRSPERTRQALSDAGIPPAGATPAAARMLGIVEVVSGLTLIVFGHPSAMVVVGVLSALFAAMVERARRAGAADCGCLGAVASPPDRLHVAINLCVALSCFIAAAFATGPTGPIAVVDVLGGQPFAGVPYALAVATAGWLVITILGTLLPTRHLIAQGAHRHDDR